MSVWEDSFYCHSFACHPSRTYDEFTDKIVLPESALERLGQRNIVWPMLFELKNAALGTKTHCSVKEFVAEEGNCYIPYWMMQNLGLEEGSLITLRNVSLPKARFTKFRPQQVEFLEMSDPGVVLTHHLRNYSCLTEGDIIKIQYDGQPYQFEVCEVKPNGAACVIETDIEVYFEKAVGYETSKYAQEEREAAERVAARQAAAALAALPPVQLQTARIGPKEGEQEGVFKAFVGTSKRIDGKEVAAAPVPVPVKAIPEPIAATAAAPQRKSLIGNKYAAKKNTVSAFTGAGHKMT